MSSAAIDRLMRIATRAAAGEALRDDGPWLAAALWAYLKHAQAGMTLDAVLGVAVCAGGEPWWTREARERRDRALTDLARSFYPDLSLAKMATAVGRDVRRYETRWTIDRDRSAMPASYVGTPREFLFIAFREGHGEVPSSRKRLRLILDLGLRKSGPQSPAFDAQPSPTSSVSQSKAAEKASS